MKGLLSIAVLVCAGGVSAQPGGGAPTGSAPSGGLTIKDFKRVEQVRGDAGGLSRSLARGPATVGTPNDFSGVYQIPEDADTPYAGWFARVSGAMIAVFPRGDYIATKAGARPTVSANTRYFLGSVPLNGKSTRGTAKREGRAVEAEENRVDNNTRTAPPERPIPRAPDAPPPVTVESATDLEGVREAMGKLCNDPVYRANRVRELVERAAGQAGR